MYVCNESLKVFVCVNFYTYALPRNFLDECFWRTHSNTFNTQSVHTCIVIYMVCMFCLCNVCVFRMSHGEFKIYALCCPPRPCSLGLTICVCVCVCIYRRYNQCTKIHTPTGVSTAALKNPSLV